MSEHFKIRDSRRPGHFWAENEFLDVYGPKIGIYAIAVYMVLCRHAHNKSGRCFPSIRRIAAITASSVSTVKRAITTLQSAGLIKVEREGTGPYATNIYTVLSIPEGICGNDAVDAGRCWYCGIEGVPMQNEHQDPVSRFPESVTVAACPSCNTKKGNRTVDEYRALFATGHRFYGEQIGSIGTHPNRTHSNRTEDEVEIGSIGATNNTKNKYNNTKPSLFTDSTDSTIQEPKHSERSKQGSSNCASKTGLGDPRFSPVVAEIFQQYKGFNQGDSPAFTEAAGRQLKMFLKSHPDWTLQKVIMCVRNRFQSDENLSSDPVNWIAHLAKWAGGPLDKFGKPRSLDDGLSKDDKRNRSSAIAIARGISNLRKGRGESFVPDRAELPAANYRGDDGIVDEDFEETDP